jgi:hypothetical protein
MQLKVCLDVITLILGTAKWVKYRLCAEFTLLGSEAWWMEASFVADRKL